MKIEKTSLFEVIDDNEKEVKKVLNDVYDILQERGYNPSNQLVGYLISGDPGYISSYNNARKKIQAIERTKIVEILLESFRKNK